MPRKRANKTPPTEKRTDDVDDDDFFFDDTQSNSGRNSHEPQHRNAANARERARMRVLSKAFCRKEDKRAYDLLNLKWQLSPMDISHNKVFSCVSDTLSTLESIEVGKKMEKDVERLKTTLPWVPADTKLSKLDTLRLAASYIAHLRALLHEPRSAHTPPHPLSLAWPFAFQHGGTLSCTISQRWNVNPQNDSSVNNRNLTNETIHPTANEGYGQKYTEDYEDRCYEEMNDCTPMQYCNYGYKEHYYEMRNAYSSESLINNA